MPSAKQAAEDYIERNGIKRKPCQVCSSKSLDMHHPDGRKPLEVSFLCRSCHMKVEGGQIKEPKPYNLVDLANNKGSGNISSQSNLVVHMATAQFNRYEEFEGRSHLIAPVVAVMEGVLNGEFCPADEIGRYVDSWNGIPLPLDHPMDRGTPVSANSPDLIQTRSLGRFFNANFDGQRLRGELWIDVEKVNNLGGDALTVLQRLENGEPLEVSTAYFRDVEPETGNYQGEPYDGVQRNLRPDHLALLPNGVGAASWQDGAGAPRVNKKEGGGKVGMWGQVKNMLAALPWLNQDVSHDEIKELLEQAMVYEKGDAMRFMIRERYDDYFVYQESDPAGEGFAGRMFKRQYTIDENRNVTLGDQEEVQKVVTYEPVTNEGDEEEVPANNNTLNNSGGESGMDKKQKVDGLITNQSTKFKEEDRQFLDGLTEEQLAKLEPIQMVTNEEGNTGEAQTTQSTEGQTQTTEENNTEENNEQQPQSFDEWVETIPDEEVREEMKTNRKKSQKRREELIDNLTKSDRSAFDKEDLQGMKTNQLEKLSKSIMSEDYSGVGGPRGNAEQEDEDSIPAPVPVILAKQGQGKEEGGNE